jgi:hypothetical protein
VIVISLPVSGAMFSWDHRADLVAADSIVWSVRGVSYTTVSQSFSIATTTHGWQVGVSKPTEGVFERRDQGDGWSGNFAPGDALLWTRDTAGPVSLTFPIPMSAVGMQIQKDDQSNPPFNAVIEAFDALGVPLGSFTREGVSNAKGDGSALFLGIRSSERNIASVKVRVVYGFPYEADFAINQVSLVPEPAATVPLAGVALAWVLVRRLRDRSVVGI